MHRALFVSIACVVAALGCGSGTEQLTGRATLRGETDSSGIIVLASGRRFSEDSVVTDAAGHYDFAVTPSFRYFLTAFAVSTKEKVIDQFVDVGDAVPVVPDFVFTPVGLVSGTATGGAGANDGIVVALEGTDLSAVTDTSGHYGFSDVPTGTYVVRATLAGRPPQTLANQTVTYKQTTTVPPFTF